MRKKHLKSSRYPKTQENKIKIKLIEEFNINVINTKGETTYQQPQITRLLLRKTIIINNIFYSFRFYIG